MNYKGYNIVSAPSSPSLYEIKFDGSGKVAEVLKGMYTSIGACKQRIDLYLEGSLVSKSKNGKTTV